MKFLLKEDVELYLNNCNLSQLTTESQLTHYENHAIAFINSYLSNRYDMAWEYRAYSTSGTLDTDRIILENPLVEGDFYIELLNGQLDDRNLMLIDLTLDILFFNLFTKVSPRQMSDTVKLRYENAIEFLRNLQKGDLDINLKYLQNSDNEGTYKPFRYGSDEYINY